MPDISLLNCETDEEFEGIFKWLNVERWTSSNNDFWKEHLTSDEYAKLNDSKQVFCYFADYDAYYTDFYQYFNIDLMTAELDWIRFNWFLRNIIEKEDSMISKRIRYRTYKPSKHENSEYKNSMFERKKTYSLVDEDLQDVYNSMKGVK